METVGFIGLGRMGTPIAVNIQKAGYPMVSTMLERGPQDPSWKGSPSGGVSSRSSEA